MAVPLGCFVMSPTVQPDLWPKWDFKAYKGPWCIWWLVSTSVGMSWNIHSPTPLPVYLGMQKSCVQGLYDRYKCQHIQLFLPSLVPPRRCTSPPGGRTFVCWVLLLGREHLYGSERCRRVVEKGCFLHLGKHGPRQSKGHRM